ncbi:TRAP transporter small permease [Aneurinibacillus sp. REN35]|uniref:TRAP transporter small permease n=1 Tax=Aneurinibacillus sp. REN35 TaxID=3237286 RepID=UPI0035271403
MDEEMLKKRPGVIRFIDMLSEWSGYLSGGAVLISTLIIVHEVVMRYFFAQPAIWQIEISMYLLLFTSFVGASYGLKHDAHVGIDLLVSKLAPRAQKKMRMFTSLLCIGLTILIGWRAGVLWLEAYENGWRAESLISTPLSIPYIALPLGMLLMTLQFIVLLYEDWSWLKAHTSSRTNETAEVQSMRKEKMKTS